MEALVRIFGTRRGAGDISGKALLFVAFWKGSGEVRGGGGGAHKTHRGRIRYFSKTVERWEGAEQRRILSIGDTLIMARGAEASFR